MSSEIDDADPMLIKNLIAALNDSEIREIRLQDRVEQLIRLREYDDEQATETAGLLADVCDIAFGDSRRAEEHGYDGIKDKIHWLVSEAEEAERLRGTVKKLNRRNGRLQAGLTERMAGRGRVKRILEAGYELALADADDCRAEVERIRAERDYWQARHRSTVHRLEATLNLARKG